MVTGMATGTSMNNIMNSLTMNTWKQSDPLKPFGHNDWVIWVGSWLSIALPVVDDIPRVLNKIPSGMAVIRSGRNATVKITMRFLKTSAHSLRIIVLILFIDASSILDQLKVNIFQRMAQLSDKLNISSSINQS